MCTRVDGGTPKNPVGLAFIGISTADGSRAECFIWDSDQAGNKEASALQALEMVEVFLNP